MSASNVLLTNELLVKTDLILAKDIYDIKVHNKIVYEINGESVNFPDVKFDICKTLTHRLDFYLLSMVSDEIHRTSNIPLKCPVKSVSIKFSSRIVLTVFV